MDAISKKKSLRARLRAFITSNPYDFLYILSLIGGTIIRLIVSLNAYGMLHPDEIFQSLEMAHLLVFGSAYIPPEFQSQYHIESYAASRTWLFPLIFAGIMRLGELLSLDYFSGTLVLIKIVLGVNAAILIPASKKFVEELTQDYRTGVIAAFIVAYYFRLIQFTVRPFSNTFFLPYLIYGFYRILKTFNEERLTLTGILEVGIYVGLVTYIRFDLGILVFALFLSTFSIKYLSHYLAYVVSGGLFWLLGAYIDFQMYDNVIFFSVPIHWFRFNIIEGYSKIFGVSGPFFYVLRLIFSDFLFIWLGITIFFVINWKKVIKKSDIPSDLQKGFKSIGFATLISWIIYSNAWPLFPDFSIIPPQIAVTFPQTHKEVRFVIGALLFLLYLIAITFRLLIIRLEQSDQFLAKRIDWSKLGDIHGFTKEAVLTYGLIMLFFVHICGGFAFGMYGEISEDINLSLMYIGNQENVEEVVVVEEWFLTGYYTYSHLPDTVEFHFYPLDDEDRQLSNTMMLRITIFQKSNSTFIVFPEYQYFYYDGVQQLMVSYDWHIVKEIEGTDVWATVQ